LAFHLFPSGWFRQNQIRFDEFYLQQYLPLADLEHRDVSPKLAGQAAANFEAEINHPSPYNLVESIRASSLKKWEPDYLIPVKSFAYAQESVDLARVAIALERYRLAHGSNPESLDALAPQFMKEIPHDIIGGGPLHYRRTSDGQFVLYSVGWNETDDGGVVVFKNGSNPRDEWNAGIDMEKSDWVWRYPQK